MALDTRFAHALADAGLGEYFRTVDDLFNHDILDTIPYGCVPSTWIALFDVIRSESLDVDYLIFLTYYLHSDRLPDAIVAMVLDYVEIQGYVDNLPELVSVVWKASLSFFANFPEYTHRYGHICEYAHAFGAAYQRATPADRATVEIFPSFLACPYSKLSELLADPRTANTTRIEVRYMHGVSVVAPPGFVITRVNTFHGEIEMERIFG